MSIGFSVNERKGKNTIQSSIFDGNGNLLKEKKDGLLYNINGTDENGKEINSEERLETIGKTAQKNIADLLIWTNFKKPSKKLIRIEKTGDLCDHFCQYVYNYGNLGYADNTIILNTSKILEELGINSLSLGGAVADSAGICGNYNNGEIISLSHVGWQGITNGVIEQLIYTYMAELGKKEFQKVQFDFSPMAGINYEWDKNSFDKNLLGYVSYLNFAKEHIEEQINYLKNKLDQINKLGEGQDTKREKIKKDLQAYNKRLSKKKQELLVYKSGQTFMKIAENYNIDFMKEKIVEQSTNPNKVIFFLDRLIQRIFLENGANIKQLNFHKEYTTDLNNTRPSYRIHTLGEKGIITPDMTLKGKNGVIPNSRIGVFNTVYKK